jgi:CubicO group peptidase (beta-lactamase class C family)
VNGRQGRSRSGGRRRDAASSGARCGGRHLCGGEEHLVGYGTTSVEHPLPVEADTLFQIGSISKTFTATAIQRLVHQGRLDLNVPIRSYLPNLSLADETATERVNLGHLLTHTAGFQGDHFPDTGDGDDALARYVAGMVDLSQLTLPGTTFAFRKVVRTLQPHRL